MRYEKIETANRLAAEFSRLCDVALSEMRERDWDYHIVGTKASGNLRHKSMELTRVLAEMRKP